MDYSHKLDSIVFITEDIFGESIGGVEQHIYHIAKELAKLGKNITIISLKTGLVSSRKSEVIYKNKGNVILIKLVKKNPLLKPLLFLEKRISGNGGMLVGFLGKLLPNFHALALIKEIDKISPDLIHQHDYLANILASKVLSKRYPVFFTNHTGQYLFLERYTFTRYIQRWLINHYAAIIGPSKELTPNDPRATYISNGVDIDFFQRDGGDIQEDRIVFICPRRWAPTKGVLYLAKALYELDNRHKAKVKILFAGSDSDDFPWYRDQILEVLSKVPKESFDLLGNLTQEALRSYFSKSHIVVIPSLMEATSLAAMEGMSCCLPVLSTDVGGMPEVVDQDITGWLVASEDHKALAAKMTEIIDGKYDISRMGLAARDFVRDKKSWKGIAQAVIKTYISGLRS